MAPDGSLTTLLSFNSTNGSNPWGGLVKGDDGSFYGMTYRGGANIYYGTLFKITASGMFTMLNSFNFNNGANPEGALVQGSDGNFYGTTSSGGDNSYGTVFKMTPTGILTTLVSFNSINGATLINGLVQGSDGNFYGTTYEGGTDDYGIVFKITPSGEFTTLYSFASPDGNPNSLLSGSNGDLYGTTTGSGGTVFRLTLNPIQTSTQLVIGRLEGNIQLSWPTNGSTGFVIQTANDLNSAAWLDAGIPIISQNYYMLTLPISSADRFFRLKKQ